MAEGKKRARLEQGWYQENGSDFVYLKVDEQGDCRFYDFEDDYSGVSATGEGYDWVKTSEPEITSGPVIWRKIHELHPRPFLSGLENALWSRVTLVRLKKAVAIFVRGMQPAATGATPAAAALA